MNCKNCNTEVSMHYCPNCGQPALVKRIDSHYIVHELVHLLHFEKGLLYTIRELLIHPGNSVKQFLLENRNRLVKPVLFIIITSLVYSVINHFFHIEEGYVQYKETNPSTTVLIFKWVQDHYGYSNMIMGVFIAVWTKLFFRKYAYNFFEILILLCFVMGMGMLIYAVFALLQGLTHYNLMQVAGVTGFIYLTWAIGQFFDEKKAVSYVKSFFAYLLGMLTFSLLAILLGSVIDLIIKH